MPENASDRPSLKDILFKQDTYQDEQVEITAQSFDWLKIPAGTVTLVGDDKNYLPRGTTKAIYVDTFWMSKYPITNRQYAPYVNAGGAKPPYWNNIKFNAPDQPIVGVSWFDVIEYCAWLSTKLPYEVAPPFDYQWQWAAQGQTNYKYPWGNRWDIDNANANEKVGQTTAVHHYRAGVSSFGVFDLSGNVWEWCYIHPDIADDYTNAPAVLCGGSWLNYEMFATVHARNIRLPNMHYNDVGFRLIRL